mgnify:CR=1 FL=1
MCSQGPLVGNTITNINGYNLVCKNISSACIESSFFCLVPVKMNKQNKSPKISSLFSHFKRIYKEFINLKELNFDVSQKKLLLNQCQPMSCHYRVKIYL